MSSTTARLRARGLCAVCYVLRQQDRWSAGEGARTGRLSCRVCDASGRDKRSITVHHRVPGESLLHLMISLCPACHNKVHRTEAFLAAMPPLLLELWPEQHPTGHEQTALDFNLRQIRAQAVPLSKRRKRNLE